MFVWEGTAVDDDCAGGRRGYHAEGSGIGDGVYEHDVVLAKEL